MRNLVVFLNPPNSETIFDDLNNLLKNPREQIEWANYPHLGILSLASSLKDIEGIEPVYFDGVVCDISFIISFIKHNSSKILVLAVSVLTATYQTGLLLAEKTKEIDSKIVTIFGNDHFTAMPNVCLINRKDIIDYGFTGNEVVTGFKRLISDLFHNKKLTRETYPSIAFCYDNAIFRGKPSNEPIFTDIDYSIVDKFYNHSEKYNLNFRKQLANTIEKVLGRKVTNGITIEIGRGCIKFKNNDACSFCSIQYGDQWRNSVGSHEVAWDVFRKAVFLGYDYLYITADEFPLTFRRLILDMVNNKPSWFRNLQEEKRPFITVYARSDGLTDLEMVRRLHDLGVRIIRVGFDSFTPLSLAAMRKPINFTKTSSRNVLSLSKKLLDANTVVFNNVWATGIKLQVGFVLGHIGLQKDHLENMYEKFCSFFEEGKHSILSSDIEILSPEPGSLDFQYVVDPDLAERTAERLGVIISDRALREIKASKWRNKDIINRNEIMEDYIECLMPNLSLQFLVELRNKMRNFCKEMGVLIG